MMAGIRNRDTKPEMKLRNALHAAGFRYRLHVRKLPGKPDLVFPKFRAVVFVHGCFWHRHKDCRLASTPASNKEFWRNKFAGNVERDARNMVLLREMGWRTATVWECAARRMSGDEMASEVGNWLQSEDPNFVLSE